MLHILTLFIVDRCGKPCKPGYHKCDDGLQCIKEERVCNGIHNCHDKSDEKQCSKYIIMLNLEKEITLLQHELKQVKLYLLLARL